MLIINTYFRNKEFVSEIKSCKLVGAGISESKSIEAVKRELEVFYETLKRLKDVGDTIATRQVAVLDRYWKNDPYFIYYLDL